MTKAQKLELRRSQVRERLAELADVDGLNDEQRAEVEALTTEYRDIEPRWRAAVIAEDGAAEDAATEYGAEPDREMRERVALRSTASLGRYLEAYSRGRIPTGPEAELNAAAGVEAGDIPIELWDTGPERETRAITGAPGTVGVNLDRIRPAVFAPSILPRLGVEMPRVPSGTYATATISTSTTAGAVAKSGDAPATAAAFTVTTATPKRVSARLELTLEDLAAVGTSNFEAALRENLSLVLSDELDRQGLTGDGNAPNLTGILQRLTDPATTPSAVATFDDFVRTYADGVDGLWASVTKEVALVVGVDTYRLSARTFRDAPGQDLGGAPFSEYAATFGGGFWTSARMPAPASDVQQAVLYRKGRTGIRRAICPHWGRVSIDDMYTGSAKAERYFTAHVLLGDVILVQPAAYSEVRFKVA